MQFKILSYLLLSNLLLSLVHAQGASSLNDNIYLQGGGYIHFSNDDDYTGAPYFVSVEVQRKDPWLYGLALFNNSFDQFSQYAYGGYRYQFEGSYTNFHAKITAGIIHGYKDEFKDKIPFNNSGFAPAIIPGLGWKKNKLGADIILLGKAGLLFTIGYDIYDF